MTTDPMSDGGPGTSRELLPLAGDRP